MLSGDELHAAGAFAAEALAGRYNCILCRGAPWSIGRVPLPGQRASLFALCSRCADRPVPSTIWGMEGV